MKSELESATFWPLVVMEGACDDINEPRDEADFTAIWVSFKSTLSEVVVPSLYSAPQRAADLRASNRPG